MKIFNNFLAKIIMLNRTRNQRNKSGINKILNRTIVILVKGNVKEPIRASQVKAK